MSTVTKTSSKVPKETKTSKEVKDKPIALPVLKSLSDFEQKYPDWVDSQGRKYYKRTGVNKFFTSHVERYSGKNDCVELTATAMRKAKMSPSASPFTKESVIAVYDVTVADGQSLPHKNESMVIRTGTSSSELRRSASKMTPKADVLCTSVNRYPVSKKAVRTGWVIIRTLSENLVELKEQRGKDAEERKADKKSHVNNVKLKKLTSDRNKVSEAIAKLIAQGAVIEPDSDDESSDSDSKAVKGEKDKADDSDSKSAKKKKIDESVVVSKEKKKKVSPKEEMDTSSD
jgi:hypothetical protein